MMILVSKLILAETKGLKKKALIRFKNRYGAITVPWEPIKTLLRSEDSVKVNIKKGRLVVVAGRAIVKLSGVDGRSDWTIGI